MKIKRTNKQTGDGRWQMGDGRWQMADGRWKFPIEAAAQRAAIAHGETAGNRPVWTSAPEGAEEGRETSAMSAAPAGAFDVCLSDPTAERRRLLSFAVPRLPNQNPTEAAEQRAARDYFFDGKIAVATAQRPYQCQLPSPISHLLTSNSQLLNHYETIH
jgi:hypothetical protein